MSRLNTLSIAHHRVVARQIGANASLIRYAFKGQALRIVFPTLSIEERYNLTKVVKDLSDILNQLR